MDFFDRDMSNEPTIPEFFKGKTIFITGGSGFMGKVLIEKLLYSCPEIDRIYLLLRSKRGVKAESRLEQIYSSICFDRLRAEKPNIFSEKVFFVGGDVMEPALGLSQEDRALLVNRVNIIYHVAASVRFDDPLPFAAKLNLGGTKQVVDFAKEVSNLAAMVHVSTSYSNTNRDTIEEVMYPPHADWRDTLEICDKLDEHTIKVLTPKYLGELPNTYTFTKQLAEHVVYEQRGRLPIIMVRPSIVVSSVSEPLPGWIENFNGPAGLLVACGKGIMRSLYTEPDLIADYMPVDISIKSMIVAAWMRGTLKLQPTDDIPIYNCCAGRLNTITMGELVAVGKRMAADLPLNDMLWNVGGTITTSKTIHYIKIMVMIKLSDFPLNDMLWNVGGTIITSKTIHYTKVLLLHCLPAIFVDTLLWLMGRKPMLLKVQRRIYIANLALQYYITKQWNFNNANFVKIRSRIKPEDHKHFFYEMETVDRNEYFKQCCIGGRKYLLKEKDEDLPKAKAHFTRMLILDKLVQCIFYGSLFWWLVNSSYVQSLLLLFVN